MASPRETVSLAIGGQAHSDWESYDIDSDLMTPADAWNVTLGESTQRLPAEVAPGARTTIRVGDDVVMEGRIDEITHRVDRRNHTLTLSGRDGAAVLLDCSAPILTVRRVDLAEIVAKIVRPLGVTRIRIDADSTAIREKITVEPGDTAWQVLANACEANGLWPWFAPDGTLIVGGPDTSGAFPVATLVMNRDGPRNNLLELSERRSMHRRYSTVTVLGQAHGTETEAAQAALSGSAADTGVSYPRPRIAIDHDADNAALCSARARKLIADARLQSYDLTARVRGHRIHAPGTAADGALWTPGQRVHVSSGPHGVDGLFLLMRRRFTGGRDQGAVTTLELKEDGLWQIDAHPHSRRYRRGRHAIAGNVESPT